MTTIKWEYRAVFSYPPSVLGPSRDSYSDPVLNPAELPRYAPNSTENHGWRSGTQIRLVTDWEDVEKDPPK